VILGPLELVEVEVLRFGVDIVGIQAIIVATEGDSMGYAGNRAVEFGRKVHAGEVVLFATAVLFRPIIVDLIQLMFVLFGDRHKNCPSVLRSLGMGYSRNLTWPPILVDETASLKRDSAMR
jgi:hypothetical protein